uniref:Uncharacterized protein n=1 Tax=uncultured archaeon MedDCM-OCT-S05-C418 TaxID=743091 RepID=D6PBK4_9ARCH|nr:hypothetical protein [uncultured archaeon MedDCM-OCT-S05-C418]
MVHVIGHMQLNTSSSQGLAPEQPESVDVPKMGVGEQKMVNFGLTP